MDCYVNNNKQVCLNIEARKCDLKFGSKKLRAESPEYFSCMKSVYADQNGNDSLEFCRFAYGNSSGVYDESDTKNFQVSKVTDQDNSGFSMEMFSCYQKSKSLKQFCDDINDLGYQVMT